MLALISRGAKVMVLSIFSFISAAGLGFAWSGKEKGLISGFSTSLEDDVWSCPVFLCVYLDSWRCGIFA